MGPEQVLSNSLNWHPCSEPAELWVSLWVFQPTDCGIRLLPDPSRSVSLQRAHLGGKRSHSHGSGQRSLPMRFGDGRTCRVMAAPPADH
jgi:hypothetical protein